MSKTQTEARLYARVNSVAKKVKNFQAKANKLDAKLNKAPSENNLRIIKKEIKLIGLRSAKLVTKLNGISQTIKSL